MPDRTPLITPTCCKHLRGSPCTLIAVPAEHLLNVGIGLPDLAAFFGTPSGVDVFMKRARYFDLRPGMAAWLPYGWLCWPFTRDRSEEAAQASESAANEISAPSVFLHLPLFNCDLAKGMPDAVRQAVMSWNREHLAKQGLNKAFAARKEAFEAFVALVSA